MTEHVSSVREGDGEATSSGEGKARSPPLSSPPSSSTSSSPMTSSSMPSSSPTTKKKDDVDRHCPPRFSAYRAFLHGIRDGGHEGYLASGDRRRGGEGAEDLASRFLASSLPVTLTALDECEKGDEREDGEYDAELHCGNFEEVAIGGDGEDLASSPGLPGILPSVSSLINQQQEHQDQKHRHLQPKNPPDFESASSDASVESDSADDSGRTSQILVDYLERDGPNAAADAIPFFPKAVPTKAEDGRRGPGGPPRAVEGGGEDSPLALAGRTSQILSNYEAYLSGLERVTLKDGARSTLSVPMDVPKKTEDGGRDDGSIDRSYVECGSDGRRVESGEEDGHFALANRTAQIRSDYEDYLWLDDMESGGHASPIRWRRCSQPILHNKKFQWIVLAVFAVCTACLGVGIASNRRKGRTGGTVQSADGIAASLRQESKDLLHHAIEEPPAQQSYGRTNSDEEAQTPPPFSFDDGGGEESALAAASEYIAGHDDPIEQYSPRWYDRSQGWAGRSYVDAIAFCASRDSRIPCPYEAICPGGPGSAPTGGNRLDPEAWAPIMDMSNGWVGVGSAAASCEDYNSVHKSPPLWGVSEHAEKGEVDHTPSIMCCRVPSSGKINASNHVRESRLDVHQLPSAYLNAASHDTDGAASETTSPPTTTDLNEQDILDRLHPIWLDETHGWMGGSHDDAMEFCGFFGRRTLCPYTAYCPHGPGQPAMGGRNRALDGEGEQWAPLYGSHSQWVMIGRKFDNSATTCMDSWELEGREPYWGLTRERADLKSHIMCCAF